LRRLFWSTDRSAGFATPKTEEDDFDEYGPLHSRDSRSKQAHIGRHRNNKDASFIENQDSIFNSGDILIPAGLSVVLSNFLVSRLL
jgi:hypothetical protein